MQREKATKTRQPTLRYLRRLLTLAGNRYHDALVLFSTHSSHLKPFHIIARLGQWPGFVEQFHSSSLCDEYDGKQELSIARMNKEYYKVRAISRRTFRHSDSLLSPKLTHYLILT